MFSFIIIIIIYTFQFYTFQQKGFMYLQSLSIPKLFSILNFQKIV